MIEVERLTIRRGIGKNIWDIIRFPQLLVDTKLFYAIAGLLDKLFVEILRDAQRLSELDLWEMKENSDDEEDEE